MKLVLGKNPDVLREIGMINAARLQSEHFAASNAVRVAGWPVWLMISR